ncbi:SigE family RNA polymerase sigma factor [Nocardioides sp.]|uniref:SigE family RNA polymerase sigma factor n=1 Tax=Nocardioides sp. TaxID=35761 RepID=UPI000C8D99A9|nr:SigE family RNA polymerase sigma factor [Nocardioides sp.]MAS56410.1 SigE family RNA polymerase sigma factor [Pimelobacter sp.]MDE0776240.1 SigE family RNA polymerase sigma factor [Nocardioides sp.]
MSEQEFEEFARARTPQLYRSAWLLCGNHHEAEDLVQETLAKVFTKWRSPFGRRIDNPAAYAQTALTRTFISARRRRSSGEIPRDDLPDPPETTGGGSMSATDLSEVRLAIVEALAGLKPADRAVLVLRYLEDLSVEETAQRMGTSSGAVRSRALRALERVRPLLDDSLVVHPSKGTTHD